MPDDDRPRAPGGDGDELDWGAGESAVPAVVPAGPPTLQGIGTPDPAAALLPSEADTQPPAAPVDPSAPAAQAGAEPVVIPATVPSMPAVEVPAVAAPTPSETAGIVVELFGRTDVGLVREHNEDNFLVSDLSRARRGVTAEVRAHEIGAAGSLFVVCDGMGGAAAGEVASQMAVDTIHECVQGGGVPKDHDALARRLVVAVEEAGRRIFHAAKVDRSRRGMGTTTTAAALVDGTLFLAQVGDSRGYIVRQGKVGLVTRDQSLVNQLIEAGQLTEAEAESFEHSNIILQALGTSPEVQVDLTHVPLRQGDRLLLCSDGLSGLVPAEIIREVLEEVRDPEAACARLIEMANAGGGHDNITVVLVRFEGSGLPPPNREEPPIFERYELPPTPEEVAPTEPPPAPSATPSADSPYRGTAPSDEQDPASPAPARRAAGGGRWAIAFLILLATGLAAYLFLSGDDSIANGPPTFPLTSAPSQGSSGAQEMRELRQRCSVTGPAGLDLFVDGRAAARFDEAGKASVLLDAGFHDLEVRDGSTHVAGERIDVRMDGENRFELLPPAAPDEPPSEEEDLGDKPDRRGQGAEDAVENPFQGPEKQPEVQGPSGEPGRPERTQRRREENGSPIPENPFD